jgi:hypothetical protein
MRDETVRAKIMAELEKWNMQAETDKFLKGMDLNDKAQDRLMAAQEMRLKAATGSGI